MNCLTCDNTGYYYTTEDAVVDVAACDCGSVVPNWVREIVQWRDTNYEFTPATGPHSRKHKNQNQIGFYRGRPKKEPRCRGVGRGKKIRGNR